MPNKWEPISTIYHSYKKIGNKITVDAQNQIGWGSVVWRMAWDEVLMPVHLIASASYIKNA